MENATTALSKTVRGIITVLCLLWLAIPSYGAVYNFSPLGHTDDPVNLELTAVITDGFPHNRVLARVYDNQGNPILGLTEDNFILLENGVYAISSLDTAFHAMAVSLVMDESGSMGGYETEVIEACSYFVQNMEPLDRGAIVKFASTAYLEVGMTYNKTTLLRSIERYSTGGSTDLWDAIALGIEECSAEPTQKAVIAFTDGQNNQTGIAYTELPALAGGEITIYTIGIGYNLNETELTYVAENTGGFYLHITDPSQMGEVLEDIRADMLSQYALHFISPNPEPDSSEREIVVEVEYLGDSDFDTLTYNAPAELPSSISMPNRTANSISIPRQASTPTTLKCIIETEAPLSESKVFYRTCGSSLYNEADMVWQGGNEFAFTVPGDEVEAPGLEFYFQATNYLSFTTQYPPYEPASLPLAIPVEPNYSPRVIHIPPYLAEEGAELTLSAQIMDVTENIAAATLYYRQGNSAIYTAVPMIYQSGEEYSAAIPANQMTAENDLYYFIRVVDNQGVAAFYPKDGAPHFLEVVDYPPPPMPECNLQLISMSIIPFEGDTVEYTAEALNPTPSTIVADGWISLYRPDGVDILVLRFLDSEPLIPDSVYHWDLWEPIRQEAPPGSYWMYAQVGDFAAQEVWDFQAFTFTKEEGTAVEGGGISGLTFIPHSMKLSCAYPNPFNSAVVIPFKLEETEAVKITIYNQLGREIAILTDGIFPAGAHSVRWNGIDASGQSAASGIYFYRVKLCGEGGKGGYTGKMLLLR